MRVRISTSSILFMAGVVFKLMFISLKCCESAHFLLSIHFSTSPLSLEFCLCVLLGQHEHYCPSDGLSVFVLSSQFFWHNCLESRALTRLRDPMQIELLPALFFLDVSICGVSVCVLWFTALHYIQEEVGKETGSLLSGIIAAAPTHQIGELNLVWYC